ncbi:unnamed protein product [Protopolystoma xenopodis]|uniref:Uncharacterized protein n=1 Tax=Protopolystoma xenopodis TaxID=117903 RepID=A0A3S5CMY6_9PLAT|nr:unnamed protein product [Protopolystoma xenopodis]
MRWFGQPIVNHNFFLFHLQGFSDCVKCLIDAGAKLGHLDRSALSVLHYAVDGENTRVIRQLIDAGANVNSPDSDMLWTPLLRCGKENISSL